MGASFGQAWKTRVGVVAILCIGSTAAAAQQPVRLGDEFQVNVFTTSYQLRSKVAHGPSGDFVVVWHSDGSSGTDYDLASVQGRRYSSDGIPLGGEFQVNTFSTSNQSRPSTSVDPEGGFVVVWDSFGSSSTDSSQQSVQGQRYILPAFRVFVADRAPRVGQDGASPGPAGSIHQRGYP
jgi:hypothetical protein